MEIDNNFPLSTHMALNHCIWLTLHMVTLFRTISCEFIVIERGLILLNLLVWFDITFINII